MVGGWAEDQRQYLIYDASLETSRVSTILVEIIFVMIWPLTFGTTFYDSEFIFVLHNKLKVTHVEIGLWVGLPKERHYMTQAMIWPHGGLWVG